MKIDTSTLFWLLFSMYNIGYVALYNAMTLESWYRTTLRYIVAAILGPMYTLLALLYIQQIKGLRAQVLELVSSESKETETTEPKEPKEPKEPTKPTKPKESKESKS